MASYLTSFLARSPFQFLNALTPWLSLLGFSLLETSSPAFVGSMQQALSQHSITASIITNNGGERAHVRYAIEETKKLKKNRSVTCIYIM